MATSSKKLALTVDEVCRMIEACATHGVAVLKFGTLHLEFGTKTGFLPGVNSYPWRPSEAYPNPVAEMTEQQHALQTQTALETEEVREREERLAQMIIEDPLGAEKMLLDGELEEEDASIAESGDEF